MKLRGSLLRNSLALTSGTAASQAIVFAASPLLSRIFSPEDFGVLANFNAWVAALALLASLRYEHAIFLARGRIATHKVVALTIALTLASLAAYVLLAAGLVMAEPRDGYLKHLRDIAFWVPAGVVAVCASSVFIQLNTKAGRFARLSTVATVQVLATVVIQVLLGVLGVPRALLIGTIAGYVLSAVAFAWWYLRFNRVRHVRREMTAASLRATAREYANFPRYSLPADAISVIVQQFIPVFVLALFSPAIAGMYAFATRVVRVPMLVLSTALTGALRKESADHVHAGRPLSSLYSDTVRMLLVAGVVPFTLTLIWGEEIFSLVFGAEWALAGRIVEVLTPGMLLEFAALPLSAFFLLTGSQRYTFWIQAGGFLALVAAFVIGRALFDDFLVTAMLVSAATVLVNLATLVLAARVTGNRWRWSRAQPV